jgi:hypothetical protein
MQRRNTMPKSTKGASAPAVNPSLKPIRGLTPVDQRYSWHCFEETEALIRESGLVPEWMPYPSGKKGSYIRRDSPHYIQLSRLGDGRLRLYIDTDVVLKSDSYFKRFLGGLLADTRLSLVKGESA